MVLNSSSSIVSYASLALVRSRQAGMLRDDIIENGYALLCVSIPQSDVDVEVIDEEELLGEVMDG